MKHRAVVRRQSFERWFCGFHHFTPEQARSILLDAQLS